MQKIFISPLKLGDSAYPLEEFIMKPHCVKNIQIRNFFSSYFPVFGLNTEIYGVKYADRGDLNPQEKRHNVPLSKSRVVVENAFWRLKNRFQYLYKR